MKATIQPYRAEDAPDVLRVLGEAMPHDPISLARFTRQVLLDPNFRPEGALLARVGGEAAGFCLAIARRVPLENAPPDTERGYLTLLGVRPMFRRQGIGSRLLEEAEGYLRSLDRSLVMVSPYAPGYFLPGVDVADYGEALGFLLRRGYAELSRPLAMETSLWRLEAPPWLAEREARLREEGLTFETYRPELTLPLLRFAAGEFPGDWVRVVRETMGRILAGEPASRLIAAHQAGEVLGFAHWENERFGPIGVAASQRGRGLGQCLMFRTLAAMREQGFRRAWFLWSDDRTAARLYTGAGFQEVRRFAILRKTI